MNEEKRMAESYEIIHALRIGDLEVVVGEDQSKTNDEKYMCAYCRQNAIFFQYDDVMVSDDYPEIIGLYGQRIAEQAEKTRLSLLDPKLENVPNGPLGKDDCIPITSEDDLNQKVVVIKPEVLRREHRRATSQIVLCIGGFGASANSRGSACGCVHLYSGMKSRYERRDILGVLKENRMPPWAKQGLLDYQHKQEQKQKSARAAER